MPTLTIALQPSRRSLRIAVSALFFVQGLCFASWASRIPGIQQSLQLSNTALGLVLLALPVGSLVALPLSGWLVARYGSRKVALYSLILYCLLLLSIGYAASTAALVACLTIFGMAGNTSNIAINTQAVGVEAIYRRPIMASFHGLWSLAGFTAAGIGSVMMARHVRPAQHFLLITLLLLAATFVCYAYLLKEEKGAVRTTPFFVRPGPGLVRLGLIAFCCMICEGAMFDWSGIYFREVVQAGQDRIGAGYTAFMCTMAAGRFLADRLVGRYGIRRTLLCSGLLIAAGLSLAVGFPLFLPAVAGFLLVGLGVSAVIPLVYSESGRSGEMAAGTALASVSSIGFLGFLLGPPMMGAVSGFSGLRMAFLIIAAMGGCITLLSRKLKAPEAAGRPGKISF